MLEWSPRHVDCCWPTALAWIHPSESTCEALQQGQYLPQHKKQTSGSRLHKSNVSQSSAPLDWSSLHYPTLFFAMHTLRLQENLRHQKYVYASDTQPYPCSHHLEATTKTSEDLSGKPGLWLGRTYILSQPWKPLSLDGNEQVRQLSCCWDQDQATICHSMRHQQIWLRHLEQLSVCSSGDV